MSEDTAHGQHFEPGFERTPPIPINGEATKEQAGQAAQAPELLTAEQVLTAQVSRVGELGVRTLALMEATKDAFQQFLFETSLLWDIQQRAQETHDNRPTDGTTQQASS